MFLGVSYAPPPLLVFLGGDAVGQVIDLANVSSCCSRAIVLLWVSMVLRAVPSVHTSDGIPSVVLWKSSILWDKVTCSPSRNSLALAWAASALSTACWSITDTSSALFAVPFGKSLWRWISFRFSFQWSLKAL